MNNTNDKSLLWEEVSTEHIVCNEWIDFRISAYRMPDGKVLEPFYSYSRKDYVVVVAFDEDERLICVRQFRQGIKEITTEFPAGGIERTDGKEYGENRTGVYVEDVLEAAKRELKEETGYESDDWTHLLSIPSNATIADNIAHLFSAKGCRKVSGQNTDDSEFINVYTLEPEIIDEMVKKGEFKQSVHCLAWMLVKERYGLK